ncbi:SLBB domain-containing protein [Carboxydochorda subterranea]|uniref:SLBB domain-containing protein n=1 Tax=Carboxydichorda subterranea TaxID=3109565 RepID=A0ABZ1BVZ4_9FIRM|nr:SLBB domain-containing protein [Limnochorda sp. L945t]WRP16959.1 SLBB domain-containing protein [Limnochorda sp. L945t]
MGGSRGRRLRPVALLTVLALVTLPAPVAAGSGPYRLGPGDLLAIGVWGHADLQVTAEVRPDGYVSFPLAGDVLAQGRTPEELGREIASRLGRFVRDPQVTVSVARFRTLKAVILGEVSRPGAYEVPPGARLPDLLGLGGGVLEQADLSNAVLTRRARDGTRTVPVDLGRVLEGGPGTEAPELEDGDVLYVPRARPAMVLGQVRNPGAHPVRPGMKVAELLALAGGFEDDADPRAARLTRRPGGESAEDVLPVDLAAALEDPTSKSNVAVRPGDLLWVPQARQVLVLGAVQAPGAYRLPPGSRLLDALAAAGGPVPERASSTALLTRAGEARSTPIPLDQLVGGGAGPLQPPTWSSAPVTSSSYRRRCGR